MKLCIECVKHTTLTNLITTLGVHTPKCEACGAVDVIALANFTPEFKKAFRTLVRYYYSEWDYHGKLGGTSLSVILSLENPLLKSGDGIDELLMEEWILELIEPMMVDETVDINLLTAKGRDIYHYTPLEALNIKAHPSLIYFSNELRVKNHFLLEQEVQAFLRPFLAKVERFIPIGTSFFRARIGYLERARLPEVTSVLNCHYKPFLGNDLGAPPPNLSSSGRLNRAGVSFLYAATNADTAIAEVRPHPGQQVSLGEFIVRQQLKVADFADIDFTNFAINENSLKELHTVAAIERNLSQPIPPESRSLYSLPQLLADVIRREGYDAVVFKSSVGKGRNITVFDPNLLEYLENSSYVYQIEDVSYVKRREGNIDEGERYVATQRNGELDWTVAY